MWSYQNPVKILFGSGSFSSVTKAIKGRPFVLITYPDKMFGQLSNKICSEAGKPLTTIDDITPNPDIDLLSKQVARFTLLKRKPEVIVALGGGSVIDTAKVFAAANGNIKNILQTLKGEPDGFKQNILPIIAIPTTAGTGSEVTCWATIWDKKNHKKLSLANKQLYPEVALIDPSLTINKSPQLTLVTALDALSHALESIWNLNSNPISARYAVAAAKIILRDLPLLMKELNNLKLRENIAKASLLSGLAFSNTKTAIAHNISYPLTLSWGLQHGIACSFTLPSILQSIIGLGGFREESLREIFGKDLVAGADKLTAFLKSFDIGHRFEDHKIPPDNFVRVVDEAFSGERGKNFIGSKNKFLEVAKIRGIA